MFFFVLKLENWDIDQFYLGHYFKENEMFKFFGGTWQDFEARFTETFYLQKILTLGTGLLLGQTVKCPIVLSKILWLT